MLPAEKRVRMLEALERNACDIEKELNHAFAERAHEASPPVGAAKVAHFCKRVGDSRAFSLLVILAILVAAAVETLTVQKVGSASDVAAISDLILVIFCAEMVVQVGLEGAQPWRYLAADPWNRFDFSLVLISLIGKVLPSLGSVTFLRLLRLLRIVKLFHSYPALRTVVQSLFLAFTDVGYVMVRRGRRCGSGGDSNVPTRAASWHMPCSWARPRREWAECWPHLSLPTPPVQKSVAQACVIILTVPPCSVSRSS